MFQHTRYTTVIPILAIGFSMTSCTEQHNPRPQWELFRHEQANAASANPKLTKEGKIPAATGAAEGGSDPITERYMSLCSSCHGESGKADGPAGQALNPKPRNFTDTAWQKKTSDHRIATVIKNGGASVGLSAMMAAWGAILSDDEIKAIVGKIRSFKGK